MSQSNYLDWTMFGLPFSSDDPRLKRGWADYSVWVKAHELVTAHGLRSDHPIDIYGFRSGYRALAFELGPHSADPFTTRQNVDPSDLEEAQYLIDCCESAAHQLLLPLMPVQAIRKGESLLLPTLPHGQHSWDSLIVALSQAFIYIRALSRDPESERRLSQRREQTTGQLGGIQPDSSEYVFGLLQGSCQAANETIRVYQLEERSAGFLLLAAFSRVVSDHLDFVPEATLLQVVSRHL